jgi:hypothetical protein
MQPECMQARVEITWSLHKHMGNSQPYVALKLSSDKTCRIERLGTPLHGVTFMMMQRRWDVSHAQLWKPSSPLKQSCSVAWLCVADESGCHSWRRFSCCPAHSKCPMCTGDGLGDVEHRTGPQGARLGTVRRPTHPKFICGTVWGTWLEML